MSAKTSVVLDHSLMAEARRAARRRSLADSVEAVLQEYAHLKVSTRRWRKAKREGRKFSSWEDLAMLGQLLRQARREGGWDPAHCRRKPVRRPRKK